MTFMPWYSACRNSRYDKRGDHVLPFPYTRGGRKSDRKKNEKLAHATGAAAV